MKDLFARLLLSYLSRLGLVLWATDPTAAAAPASEPTDQLPQGGDGGAADEGQGENDSEGGTEGDAALSDREKQIRKLERRIGTRTRALGQQAERIAQLQAENEALRRARATSRNDPDESDDDADPAPRGARSAVDVETSAREMAVDLRRREKIAERTSTMLDTGKKLDPQFRDLVLDVAADLPFIDERTGAPSEFIEEVLDTDRPADLLLHLARNPEIVESLQGLTGRKLGRRIAQLELQLPKSTPTRSSAPTPLTPVGGRGNSAKAEKAMTDAEWLASRRAA